jgi:hypothetical protein
MISADETKVDEVVNEEGMKAFNAWMDDLVERGVTRAHEGLQPSRTATTVHVRGDVVLPTDGPYIEAKEQIGGFALIEVDESGRGRRDRRRAPRLLGGAGGGPALACNVAEASEPDFDAPR